MNQQPHDKTLTYILLTAVALFLITLLCSGSFGLGMLAGRLNVADVVSASGLDHPLPPADISETGPLPGDSAPHHTQPAPENFDVFWEAMDLLADNFDGEVPRGQAITYGAVEGILQTVENCDPGSTVGFHLEAGDNPRGAPANFAYFWTSADQLYVDCGDQIPPPDELVYLAANGVIEQLGDHYTALLSPERAESYRIDLSSSFEGIGATVQPADEETGTGVIIVYPFPGSPAEQAGLRPDDEIIAVDQIDVTEMGLDDAIALIRGPAGSIVVLSVKRDETAPFDVEITRDRIDIPVLESEITAENLLHISLYDFSNHSGEEMKKALKQGIEAGVDGIILDLRGNPGGRLDMAIDIAGMFIEDGVVVSESGQRNVEHKARGKALVGDLPVAVLVDGGSASASEIVAGAIQDYGRGLLIGEQTFGKGSVQTLYDLSDGSMLRVTTARWFTPNGRQINGNGLEPDIEVEYDPDQPTDTQLRAAIDYLLDQIQSQ
jgi:carboxyl-terminal processing protease